MGRRFRFAVEDDEKTAVAFGCLAVAHSVRYPNAHRELFPNAVSVAVSDAVRGRYPLVHALAHGCELRQYDHRLFRDLSVPYEEKD